MQNSPVSLKVTGKTGDSLLLSKTLKFLAGLIIFFATTQLGLHFWPLSSLVYGIRIDYLSPTLYFLDILVLVYLGLATKWDWRSVLKRNSWLQAKKGSAAAERTDLNGILLFLPLLLTNLLYSQNPLSTLNWSLHFLLYFAFLVSLGSDLFSKRSVLKRNSRLQVEKGSAATERTDLNGILRISLSLALLFQLSLGLTQFSLGHSVGGLMYYLGERTVAVGSPGIATTTFMDRVVLRPYGTFSHPNILAGWSVVVLLVLRRLLDRRPEQSSSRDTEGGRRLLVGTLSTLLIIFLTNSRSAALAMFGFVIPFYLFKITKLRTLFFYFIMIGLTTILTIGNLSRQLDLSASQRLTLQELSLSVIKTYPFFGTGAQASISSYPLVDQSIRLLQPDHNSFTLFLSWFGIFGLIGILYSLRPTTYNLRSLLPILPLLLLDHYLLTSPQGLFVILLYLSVAVNYPHAQKNRQ